MNHVTISGRAGQDPELRFSANGTASCSFSIAVEDGRGDEKKTYWFDVITFQTLAENISETISKGMMVIVTGKLQQRSWETPEGEKRSRVEIVAWNVGPDLTFASAVVTRNERPARQG